MPGSRALVSGSPETRAIIEAYEPAVIRMLGTEWDRPYIVEEVAWRLIPDFKATTRAWDRRVKLYEPDVKAPFFDLTVLHELVHVHMRGDWEDLPPVLQEGIAAWIALEASGKHPTFDEMPSPELMRQVLVLTLREFWNHEDRDAVYGAAAKMASGLFPRSTSAGSSGP